MNTQLIFSFFPLFYLSLLNLFITWILLDQFQRLNQLKYVEQIKTKSIEQLLEFFSFSAKQYSTPIPLFFLTQTKELIDNNAFSFQNTDIEIKLLYKLFVKKLSNQQQPLQKEYHKYQLFSYFISR